MYLARPIPLLWTLKLNTNSKISVAFLLSLGVLASLSACIRLKYTVNLNNTDDYLFSVGDVMIWGYAENGVGFIVGCISTLRPLFRKIFHLGGSSDSSHKLGDSERGSSPLSKPQRGYGDPYYTGDESHGKCQTAVTSSQMGNTRKDSETSNSGESEKYILQELRGSNEAKSNNKQEKNDLGGIQVSRSVHQRRD